MQFYPRVLHLAWMAVVSAAMVQGKDVRVTSTRVETESLFSWLGIVRNVRKIRRALARNS